MVPSKPPSLSSLQAALRKQPGGQKRPADDSGDLPPPKKASISKSGSPAGKQAQGLSAKMAPIPGGSPPERPIVKTPGSAAKSSPSSFVKKAATPGPPPHANGGLPPKSPAFHQDMDGLHAGISLDDPLSATAVADLVSAIEQVPGSGKVRHVTKLAEALGQTLQIEHLNHFLKTLRKKVAERATADGVQVPSEKTARAANAARATAAAAKSGATASPVSTAVKAAVQAKGAQTPKTPSQAPAQTSPAQPPVKAPPASAVKSPAAVAKVPPAKSPPQTQAPKAALVKSASKAKSAPSSDSALSNGGTPAPFGKSGSPAPPASPAPEGSPAPDGSPPPLDGDPLYVLAGELTSDPVTDTEGNLKIARLDEVFRRLWDGAAKKPKDWVAAWLAMVLPVERQAEALQRFFNMAFVRTEDPEKAPAIVAELMKNHRIKLKSVEEVLGAFGENLDGILALNEEAWQVYAFFLMHVFPKPKDAGWGWSRVGWSWLSWWQFVEKCISTLEGSKAFDVVAMILRLIQDREGMPLAEVQTWSDGEKLSRMTGKLAELGSCTPDEVVERLGEAGVATAGLV